jgi:hypothetical protein
MHNEISTAANLLFTPGQIIEVRAITDEGMASGYFDSIDDLAAKVETLDVLPHVQGIYVTLNAVNPALFARRANRIKMRLSKKDATTADTDIIRRQWFPVDVDPPRPSGVSSTDNEHQAAITRAVEVSAYLGRHLGWPAPILADSANGAHLLYKIDLPNDDASRDLVKRCLEVLAARCDDAAAKIDTANYNAARIWKLYGTMSRKGDDTEDRPHRRAAVLDAPVPVELVTQEQLERLAGALPSPSIATAAAPLPAVGQPVPALDLKRWLSDHAIGIQSEKPYEGGTIYQLSECPFSGDHKDGAFAIQFPSGAIHAGCHHQSCGGGSQRWQELRARLEPKKERMKADSPPRFPPPGPSPVPGIGEIPGMDDALTVLQHGNPKQVMLRTFALDHEGDETVAECMILSIASRSIINTKGLHVSVTGESGKGKSHAFGIMIKQLPERYQLYSSMSNKALFYMEDLLAGMAIVLDDTNLSEDMAEVLKGVTTSFQRPYLHRTVTKDRKPLICTIPERCVWWVAKVEGSGDDQVFNRMLTCWIDDSVTQDDLVLNHTLAACETVPEHGTRDRPEILMCRAIWEVLGQQQYYVIIPFATRIRFQSHRNRRNPEMLLDLIKANALLRVLQRERKEVNGLNCIVATREDFDNAVRLYAMLNGCAGGQDTKLTKKESDLLGVIIEMHQDEFTVPQLQKATGLSNGALHRLLHGYASRGVTYTGLLEKCPAIAYTDRTVVVDAEFCNGSTRRRTNAYTFDMEIFATWGGSAGVWLAEDPASEQKRMPEDPPAHNEQNKSPHNPASCDVQKSTPEDSTCAALQQSSSNPPAIAAHNAKSTACPDSGINPIITHLDMSNNQSSSKMEITQQPAKTPARTAPCSCDPAFAVGQDPNIAERPQNSVPKAEQPQNSLQQIPPDSKTVLEDRKTPAGELMAVGVKIRAADYKRLDIPEPRAVCYCCGKRGSWYVEKLTAERRARPKDAQDARRICRKCYDGAVHRDRAAAPPLPGVIDLAKMERHAPNIGKCTVCNLSPAVYYDPETDTKLCEQCREREIRRQVTQSEVTA